MIGFSRNPWRLGMNSEPYGYRGLSVGVQSQRSDTSSCLRDLHTHLRTITKHTRELRRARFTCTDCFSIISTKTPNFSTSVISGGTTKTQTHVSSSNTSEESPEATLTSRNQSNRQGAVIGREDDDSTSLPHPPLLPLHCLAEPVLTFVKLFF